MAHDGGVKALTTSVCMTHYTRTSRFLSRLFEPSQSIEPTCRTLHLRLHFAFPPALRWQRMALPVLRNVWSSVGELAISKPSNRLARVPRTCRRGTANQPEAPIFTGSNRVWRPCQAPVKFPPAGSRALRYCVQRGVAALSDSPSIGTEKNQR